MGTNDCVWKNDLKQTITAQQLTSSSAPMGCPLPLEEIQSTDGDSGRMSEIDWPAERSEDAANQSRTKCIQRDELSQRQFESLQGKAQLWALHIKTFLRLNCYCVDALLKQEGSIHKTLILKKFKNLFENLLIFFKDQADGRSTSFPSFFDDIPPFNQSYENVTNWSFLMFLWTEHVMSWVISSLQQTENKCIYYCSAFKCHYWMWLPISVWHFVVSDLIVDYGWVLYLTRSAVHLL